MHQIYSVYTEVVIICLRSLMITHIRITFHSAVFNHVIAAHTTVHLSDIMQILLLPTDEKCTMSIYHEVRT